MQKASTDVVCVNALVVVTVPIEHEEEENSRYLTIFIVHTRKILHT